MILHDTPGIRSKSSEHGSKMKKMSAPPSDRRSLRRAAVAVDAAAVGVGRDADDVPERFGELAAVIIPKLAGNIQHRAVGLPQEPGSAMHFLRAQKRRRRHAVHAAKAAVDERGRGAEALRELRDRQPPLRVLEQICADLLGELHLRLRVAVLRLGHLLLATGAALGPYGLGVIEVNDAVKLLSELGMAFLFLLAGYEIDPKRLAGHQGKVGLLTWGITLGLAWLVVTFLPFFTKQGINGVATVIALTTTALGTLMPILKERNLEGTPIGDAIISYGTWGELGPILAMAILLSTRTGWQTMLVLGAFLAICLLCAMLPTKALRTGHRLYRFLTENANTSSQTLMRLTTFLLIFLVTISALFELDAVLGAFAAGFILRYIIPDGSKSLEMKLEGVGYGFLIPVFFVVSGAAINVRAVAGRPALLVAFIVMLMLIRAVPVYVALSLDKRKNPLSSHHRVTVALYCTTALPIIVAVTSLAVKVGTMQSDTASTLVAAGAITVFLMPLLGSITYQVADVHPVTAVREIAHTPSDWRTIVREHAQVRALLHHQDRLKRMAETLESLEKQEGLNGLDSRRAELVERARLEIDRQLKELGLDPQLTTQLPHNYRYPKN